MKTCVYTIALNEEKNVKQWLQWSKYADVMLVADTGSTDRTVELLREGGAIVVPITVNPWRFDVARNAALAHVPEDVDVCISLDLDETLDYDWDARLKEAWKPGVTRLWYPYYFGGRWGKSFTCDKIHARKGYRWKRAVHENVVWVGEGQEKFAHSMVKVYQSQEVKETRNTYLPLLKLAHEEDPEDLQVAFWYGRDLTYARRFEEAATVLDAYLKKSTWTAERSEAYRLLAMGGEHMTQDYWLHKANAEYPRRKEVFEDFATFYYGAKDWANLFWACHNGLAAGGTETYLDRTRDDLRFYDYGSLACYHLDMFQQACRWVNEAIKLSKDPRLEANRKFMYEAAALGRR